jgi:hypothetical protein
VRLTYRHFEIYPQVAARNDTVHIAWQQIAGPMHISYMRSTDGGNGWSSIVNLEEAGHFGAFPDLSLFPSGLFVGWFDEDTSNATTYIAYSNSSDGSVWSVPEYVSQDVIRMFDLGTAAFGDSIYAVYFSRQIDTTHTYPLRFLYSSDMGASWSDEITVGHVDEYTNFLHMAHCKNSLYVVWASTPAPLGFYREVMAAVSHDGGVSWSEVMQLSAPDTAVAQLTCVACDEEAGNFAVGWMDEGSWYHYPGDLYVRITIDGGHTWMPESHATYDRWVMRSSLAIKGDSLWAVWDDRDPAYGQYNDEICFARSTDLGGSWSPYERLSYNMEHSKAPTIAHDNGKLHVVWYNDNPPPDSGVDIYYKRYDPEPIGIDEEENLPDKVGLTAYPNPFNSATTITVDGGEDATIEIFDIAGRRVAALHAENGKAVWQARGLGSGVYFARASGGKTSEGIKLVYLK